MLKTLPGLIAMTITVLIFFGLYAVQNTMQSILSTV